MKKEKVMYSNRKKFYYLIILTFLFILFAITGCSHFPAGVQEKGIVAWNYTPIQSYTYNESNEQKIPVSIRVNNFESKESQTDLGFPGAILRLFPILSLLASPFDYTNRIFDDHMTKADLKEFEVENILVEEIRETGLITKIVQGGEPKDFDMRGNVNFSWKDYRHFSGLGNILYIAVLPPLLLPISSYHFTCEAHLEVVSKDGRIILAKDYNAKTKCFVGLIYGNAHRHYHAYGKELFPQIVKQFIADLKAIPKTVWGKH